MTIPASSPSGSGSGSRKRSSTTTTATLTTGATAATLLSPSKQQQQQQQPKQHLVQQSSSSFSTIPPKYVLVIDNGGDTIKYGYYRYNTTDTNNSTMQQCQSIPNLTARLPQQWKVIVGDDIHKYRMKQQHNTSATTTTTSSSSSSSSTQPQYTSSMERSIITNMGNQIQIWKHILDTIQIGIQPSPSSASIGSSSSTTSLLMTETAMAFGWHIINNNNNNQPNRSTSTKKHNETTDPATTTTTTTTTIIPSHQCAVMIGLAPYTPRSIIDHIVSIWFQEFHFHSVGFCISSIASATTVPPVPMLSSSPSTQPQQQLHPETSETTTARRVPCCCVVDFGYSATYIIPVYENRVIHAATKATLTRENSTNQNHNSSAIVTTSATTSIRRIPIGGKHMIQLLKYYYTYRQWNLMDADSIVRDVYEKTSFVSMQFISDMKLASSNNNKYRGKSSVFGKKYYDCQYILPNYDTTFVGQVHVPESVRVQQEMERMKLLQQQQDDESAVHDIDRTNITAINNDDVDNNEDDEDEDDEDYNDSDIGDIDNDDDDGAENDDDDEDEEESPDQIRQRLMKQREEERRLREIEAEQQQILNVSTERFAVPESLFRPSDMGLPTDIANVPQAIVQSIESCPMIYRPALYQNIQLTGGVSLLPNLKERLYRELRALVPSKYTIQITVSETPIEQAWKGMVQLTRTVPYEQWSVNRLEWEDASKRGAWIRLQMNKGGYFI